MINVRMQNQGNHLKPQITVVGVGGAGGNAVNNMIHSGLEGCEFLVCNTDAQALEGNDAPHKLQLGTNVTCGLGAGANPEVGRAAAEESMNEIMSVLEGSNMVFVTAGMGGGTGTGAAPVIAQVAREAGILTIGVVTKPFHFEGTHRMKLAEAGIAELQKHVDTLIIIPNQNLFRIANEKTTFSDAFRMADEVLQSGVRGVTDLMVMPGLINLDFADIRAVMAEMGKAMMGTGDASGERRAVEAAEAAISNPLLDDISMNGAKGVLINITGGLDMTLFEVDEAANRIRDEVDSEANIIFGSTFDESMEGVMRVSVVATGIEADTMQQDRPLHLTSQTAEPSVYRPNTALGMSKASTGFGSNVSAPVPQGIIPRNTAATTPQHNMNVGSAVNAGAPVMSAKTQGQSQAPQIAMGKASVTSNPVNTTNTATARKWEDVVSGDVNVQPEDTQTINRPTSGLSAQPRAQRHGNSFIPPKPVDPKIAASGNGDLFEGSEVSAQSRTQQVAEKPVKKSPSLFERFTLGRHTKEEKLVVEEEVVGEPKLSVQTGGKNEEDELDIPAFLRRQAN